MKYEVTLPGSSDLTTKTKQCHLCGGTHSESGGVEVRAGRFVCRHCWRFQAISRARRKRDHGQDR